MGPISFSVRDPMLELRCKKYTLFIRGFSWLVHKTHGATSQKSAKGDASLTELTYTNTYSLHVYSTLATCRFNRRGRRKPRQNTPHSNTTTQHTHKMNKTLAVRAVLMVKAANGKR